MYIKLHSLVINTIARNTGACSRVFQYNIRRKSDLISPQSYFFKELVNVLPKLVDKVSKDNSMPENVLDRFKKISEYITYKENMFRGPLALLAYEKLERAELITEKSISQIRTLAWGAEMVHAYFMLLDDLDKSPGATCWCRYDPSLLRSFIYELLRMEFGNDPSYVDTVHLFNKTFLNTTTGHHLDIMNRKRCSNFTNETYNSIADLKTSSHTFQLPISLALQLLKSDNGRQIGQIQDICLQLGRLYHMQTDYLDCYGEEADESGIPKHSCDIQLGRCSWLAVSALQRCTPAQRIVFAACYGSTEPAHVERVKLLYDQLHLPKLYREQRNKMCDDILSNSKDKKSLIDGVIVNVLDIIKNRDNLQ